MNEQDLNRRRFFGFGGAALAAGVGAGMLPSVAARAQAGGDALPDMGMAQAPTITDPRDQVVYITGASSGIGLGCARIFHEAGMKVALGYRSEGPLAEALSHFPQNDPRLLPVQHDVTDRDGWERTADAIEAAFGPVTILVNNAGVGLSQPASTGTLNDWEFGMGVNFWGPVYGVHTFVPRMLAHGKGAQIVTTTSTSGILPGSGAGIYTVAKIAAVGLMEELRLELRETNIGTSAFIPGLTVSNIGDSERSRPADLRNEDAAPADTPDGAPRFTGGVNPGIPGALDPLDTARVLLRGILHNDLFIVTHPEYRVGVEARCNALLESMQHYNDASRAREAQGRNLHRTPIYVQEIQHRRATSNRGDL